MSNQNISVFNEKVVLKYQLYNSLFTNLPFHKVEKTGLLLSILQNECEEGYRLGKSPDEIMSAFFERHTSNDAAADKIDIMFRLIQYAERQVVLFDALEDAAFPHLHQTDAVGNLNHFFSQTLDSKSIQTIKDEIKHYKTRVVLTAHPTQFYPSTILSIINKLSKALEKNDVFQINELLQQLGKTPFFQQQKPTPINEAQSLIWYLENVFYKAYTNISYQLLEQTKTTQSHLEIGFWPGGDRDGNPFVTSQTTLEVANLLRQSIVKCYYLSIRTLKQKLTFKYILPQLILLEQELYEALFINTEKIISIEQLIKSLNEIRTQLIHEHNGLFLKDLDLVIIAIKTFGLHFAHLDIRQEANIHSKTISFYFNKEYAQLSEEAQMNFLTTKAGIIEKTDTNPLLKDTINTVKAIAKIQLKNGQQACNRYIISQCKSAVQVLEVFFLLKNIGFNQSNVKVDIVPLFETIDDLKNSTTIIQTLYTNETYRKHLAQRNQQQTIMLGFSDGTKDGGYLAANIAIYNAKKNLADIGDTFQIETIFFDGRGGPPSRGGGKTSQYYASMNPKITKQIQLTVQGQTISSLYGTIASATYNIEQILTAGMQNMTTQQQATTQVANEAFTLQQLSKTSFESYSMLKKHPMFLSYLSNCTPVKYYNETNIASRPSKRNQNASLQLSDLRAIPYVGAWAQIKQAIPGFYGVGTALLHFEQMNKFEDLIQLYDYSLHFRTLLNNCEMVLKKCFFPLTKHLSKEAQYAEIWQLIYDEFELTKRMILKLNKHKALMQSHPIDAASISLREKITLPLLTIQQVALGKIRNENPTKNEQERLKKIIIRTSFGIINAGRNVS